MRRPVLTGMQLGRWQARPQQGQQTLHSSNFVTALAALRKQQFTQEQIAALAGLSAPTVRMVERCGGDQVSLGKMLAALSLGIEGRNLPAGVTIGRRVAALRKRRGFTQRELAAALGIAPATINRMENSEASSVATLAAALDYLGAGAYLAAAADASPFYTHAGNSSVNHAWRTPTALLDRLYAALGAPFDLDPCSPTGDRRTAPVRARVYYTAEDNGLALPWRGKVFVNPPYGRTLRQWVSKAQAEVTERRADLVVALVPARTETLWWHHHIAGVADAFMLRGRLSFGNGTPAPFPSALILWGATAAQVAGIRQEISTAWHVPGG
jgi:phage N-6-adenine-methyltransferase